MVEWRGRTLQKLENTQKYAQNTFGTGLLLAHNLGLWNRLYKARKTNFGQARRHYRNRCLRIIKKTFFSLDAAITSWALFRLSTNRFWEFNVEPEHWRKLRSTHYFCVINFVGKPGKWHFFFKNSSAAWVSTLTSVRRFTAVNRKTHAVILFCTRPGRPARRCPFVPRATITALHT